MEELHDLNPNPLRKRDYFVVSSMLFGLFFGAGNLIFPIHLGQLAGGHWVLAALGFLVTAVLLSLLSVLAISVTRSEGVYDVGKTPWTGICSDVYDLNSCDDWPLIWDAPDSYRSVYGWCSATASLINGPRRLAGIFCCLLRTGLSGFLQGI